MHHIRATLPDIKQRISQQLAKFNAELTSLGGPHGDTSGANVVLNVITEFTADFRSAIDGNINDLSVNELSGGARISFVFHELFNNGIKSLDPFDQVKDGDIRTILYNTSVSCVHFSLVVGHRSMLRSGLDSVALRPNFGVRDHREAADQAVRRALAQVLSTDLRRADPDSGPAAG